MQETRFDVVGPNDGFQLALRRQGWHLTAYKPVYADPHVIRPQPAGPWGDVAVAVPAFYQVFGDNTARKLLRAALTRGRTREALARICGDDGKLDATLQFLEWCRILARDGETWSKGPACTGIDNTGPTLEWYVAEWFRHELHVPARHGVTLQEVQGGGDLDVVAFVNDIRVFVECKTGKPESLQETDVRWFLQRMHDFSPEIGVLLIDTESPVKQPVRLANGIMAEMSWLKNRPEAMEPSDYVGRPSSQPEPEEVPGYPGVYSLAPHAFLTGVADSIDASLSAILRFYHSYVRHQLIQPIPPEWSFVERKVRGRPEQRFGVEGQVWFG